MRVVLGDALTSLAGMLPDVRPAFVVPMKAVLTAERPAGRRWVFERKLDGIRCLAVKDGGRTRLYSRNKLSLNDRYAPLAAALDADPADGFIIDGEAVAFVGGRDRFGGGEGGELFYYVFDVLFADGRDVRSLPLEERRAMLEGVLRWRDPVRVTEQLTGDGAALLADACQGGWEGLIAKRLGTPYVSTRSRDWLKLK
ncbi:MAG TPA: RNA ligase family protein, partial [Solirubrobacteraceae bacterium]|nr:RNA ligase family protein [Solirubrobacteraceae bacterium]